MTATREGRRPGRPRSEQARLAILQATRDLVADEGFGGFSIERVAARAGVGKATIYRRWATREALVRDAMQTLTEPVSVPDTGTLRDDLLAFYGSLSEQLGQSPTCNLVAPVAAEAVVSEPMAEVLHEFVAGRRQSTRVMFERAIERGELGPDVDVDVLIDVLAGPLFYRLLLSGAPIDRRLVAAVVDIVLDGVGNRPS